MNHERMKAYAAQHPEVRWQFWNEHHNFWQTVRKGGKPAFKDDVKYRIANKYLRQAPQNDFDIVAQAKAKMAKTREEIIARKDEIVTEPRAPVDDAFKGYNGIEEMLSVLTETGLITHVEQGKAVSFMRYDMTLRETSGLAHRIAALFK